MCVRVHDDLVFIGISGPLTQNLRTFIQTAVTCFMNDGIGYVLALQDPQPLVPGGM